MPMLVNDPSVECRLRAERERSGADRYDEVWEGTYMMAPLPNNEHLSLQSRLVTAIQNALGWDDPAQVLHGANISDREQGWEHNYRCPDVVVFLATTSARNLQTHWVGGPDFAVEVTSPGDRTREKLEFYASVNTRELLIVDRDPWSLELIHFAKGKARPSARSTPDDRAIVTSAVLPLTFRLEPDHPRPRLVVTHRDTAGLDHLTPPGDRQFTHFSTPATPRT